MPPDRVARLRRQNPGRISAWPGVFDRAGKLAMANTGGPDTGGCQFFVAEGPMTQWNGKYARFGFVVEGQDVVSKINHAPVRGDKPVNPAKLFSVTIERVGPEPVVKKKRKRRSGRRNRLPRHRVSRRRPESIERGANVERRQRQVDALQARDGEQREAAADKKRGPPRQQPRAEPFDGMALFHQFSAKSASGGAAHRSRLPSTRTGWATGRCSWRGRPPAATITMAKGRCESEPMACDSAAGSRPSVATSMVIMMGRNAYRALHRRILNGVAAGAQLVDVLQHDDAGLYRHCNSARKPTFNNTLKCV